VIGWLAVQVSIWLLYASQLPQNLPTKWLISGQWDLLLQVPFALVLLVQVPLFALLLIPNMVSGWYLGLWGLLTASFAFSGHTWSSTNHLLSLFARFLHLASGALWLGGIVYLLIIVWKQQKKLFDLIKQFRTFFSKTALTASILLIASGLLLAGTQTDWSAILSFHTFWSRFLLIKICLVFGMLIYAFFQTRQWKTVGTLEKDSLRTEWILGLLALLLGIWMSQIAYPILPS
jgi:copper transport protein